MTRDTSIEAYREAQASGLINHNEFTLIEVADIFWREEGHTTKELMRALGSHINRDDWERIQDFQKVIKPLKDKGVFEELKKRPCQVTGHQAYPVRLTYTAPARIERQKREPAVICANEHATAARVIAWINDSTRSPANTAFTEGPDRQVAYAVEWIFTQLKDARDEIRRLKNGELF